MTEKIEYKMKNLVDYFITCNECGTCDRLLNFIEGKIEEEDYVILPTSEFWK